MTSAPPNRPKAPPAPRDTVRVDSRALFAGASVVEIEHNGQRYQLRITRENKLILTK